MKTNKNGVATEKEHGWVVVVHGWEGEVYPLVFDDPDNFTHPIWGEYNDTSIFYSRQLFKIYPDRATAEKMKAALEKDERFETFEVKEIVRNWRLF